MIGWLHAFHPQAILFSYGFINIHWYGLFFVIGLSAGFGLSCYLARRHGESPETIFDLAFWLIIFGLLGARLYDVALEWPYYAAHPTQILMIWRGGLAIHGGLIAGALALFIFIKKHHLDFWKLSSLLLPGLALAQAIGRFGNYFNQELFGRPTVRPWGIPIDLINRPEGYSAYQYFHPTFLYESLGCLFISLTLIALNLWIARGRETRRVFYVWTAALYMILYSVLRYLLEFIRIDTTPIVAGLRWPQLASLFLFLLGAALIVRFYAQKYKDRQKLKTVAPKS